MVLYSRIVTVLVHLGMTLGQVALGTRAEAGPPHGPQRVPTEVILYVHPEVTDRGFVEPLLCALEGVLVAPVSAKDLPLPLGHDLDATRTQLDAAKVADRFRQATAADGDSRTFKHLVIAHDMTIRPYNFLFASTFGTDGDGAPLQVVSTARLAPPSPGKASAAEIALTVQRLYKVIIRSIVQNTGHLDLTGCVMAFPSSLAEHDRKSANLCAADRALLVKQGVLREREGDGCQAVAAHGRRLLSSMRSPMGENAPALLD